MAGLARFGAEMKPLWAIYSQSVDFVPRQHSRELPGPSAPPSHVSPCSVYPPECLLLFCRWLPRIGFDWAARRKPATSCRYSTSTPWARSPGNLGAAGHGQPATWAVCWSSAVRGATSPCGRFSCANLAQFWRDADSCGRQRQRREADNRTKNALLACQLICTLYADPGVRANLYLRGKGQENQPILGHWLYHSPPGQSWPAPPGEAIE